MISSESSIFARPLEVSKLIRDCHTIIVKESSIFKHKQILNQVIAPIRF